MIRRREFIGGLGGAVSWPLAARAQQPERVRRVGVLMAHEENDSLANGWLSAFGRRFSELGWTDGRNILIEVRWGAGDVERIQARAKEVVDLRPDAILATTTVVTAALARLTRTIPIVFVLVSDPVGGGFVASLPRPGGNITGFISIEATLTGKYLGLLTEIAPTVKRAAILFNPDTAPGGGSYHLPAFEAAARSLKVEPIAAPVHSDTEIETVVSALGREPGGGIVVMNDLFVLVHRTQIILAASRYKVPAVYFEATFARDGGLLAYGPDRTDIFHRAAGYVDRILRGADAAELPVQLPIKYEMILNAKTAKALSLAVPPSISLRADEVIE